MVSTPPPKRPYVTTKDKVITTYQPPPKSRRLVVWIMMYIFSLSKYSVDQLRKFLVQRNMHKYDTKKELIDRLTQAMTQESNTANFIHNDPSTAISTATPTATSTV